MVLEQRRKRAWRSRMMRSLTHEAKLVNEGRRFEELRRPNDPVDGPMVDAVLSRMASDDRPAPLSVTDSPPKSWTVAPTAEPAGDARSMADTERSSWTDGLKRSVASDLAVTSLGGQRRQPKRSWLERLRRPRPQSPYQREMAKVEAAAAALSAARAEATAKQEEAAAPAESQAPRDGSRLRKWVEIQP